MEDRTKFLGASDVASIFNKSPYTSAYELALRKQGKIPEYQGNSATSMGQDLEPVVLKEAAYRLGPIHQPGRQFFGGGHPLTALPDGMCNGQLVEIKTAGIVGPLYGNWGEAYSDQVPDHYILQTQAQMLCSGTTLCHLFALLGGRGIVHYQIHRDKELCEFIANATEDWWKTYVLDGQLPEKHGKVPLEVYRRLKREPGKVAVFGEEQRQLVFNYITLKNAMSEGRQILEGVERDILHHLGDADGAVLEDGTQIEYREIKRSGYTVKPTTYRVLRVKEPEYEQIHSDDDQGDAEGEREPEAGDREEPGRLHDARKDDADCTDGGGQEQEPAGVQANLPVPGSD